MLDWMGALLVVGACSTLGLAARERLRQRVRVLDSMLAALAFLRAEIEGLSTPLPDVLHRLAAADQPVQAQVFGEICRRMAAQNGLSLSFHWNSTFRDLADDLALQEEEIAILRDASNFLGRYDVQQQLRSLDYTTERLEACRRNACEVLCHRGNIYRLGGFAAGVVVVICLL